MVADSPLSTPPSPTIAATLETADGLWLALGRGCRVWLAHAETSVCRLLLDPSADNNCPQPGAGLPPSVSAAAFCRTCSHLAVGAGSYVAVYEPTGECALTRKWWPVARLAHTEVVSALAWATADVGLSRVRVLWVAGTHLARWSAADSPGAEWAQTWCRALAQPVRHMSASNDGSLLATAGAHDQLVKVWQQQRPQSSLLASAADGQSYDFSYLRHPGAVLSLEWRPSAMSGGSGSTDDGCGDVTDSASDASFLLTLCSDGVPRLWRGAMPTEPMPQRMFLCSTLTVDASGTTADDAASLQLVQWLPPTTRPVFPPASPLGAGAAAHPGLDRGQLSPRVRPPLSPLLSPGLGVPTLKPSLRDRHDYLLGQLSDGTLVVWLLLGLSSDPRCSPKLMVWATLPHTLPAVAGVRGAVAFCNMAPMPHRADQLPGTISVVQHIADDNDCQELRLCAINVERGATGERVHQRKLRGHSQVGGDIIALAPHPNCSLAASLGAAGELLLWQSSAFSSKTAARGGASDGLVGLGDDEAKAALREAPDALEAAQGSPTCLLRLPGHYEAIAWLPSSAADGASLVALEADRARLYGRSSNGSWLASSSVHIPLPTAQTDCTADAQAPARHRWICAHALAPTAAAPEATSGFALCATACSALVWTAAGRTLRAHGFASLERDCASTQVRCASPLPNWPVAQATPAGVSPLGALICGYADGTICVWTIAKSTHGIQASLQGVLPGPSPLVEVLSVATSWASSMLRAAIVLGGSGPSPSSNRLQLLEFESCAPAMQVEFESELCRARGKDATSGTPCCALFADAAGTHTVVVASAAEVAVFVQLPPRQQQSQSARWGPLKYVTLPGRLTCTALAWTPSGALLTGAGAVFLTWPDLLDGTGSTVGTLPQWHPAVVRQQLLAQPKRCQLLLRHLAGQSELSQAAQLDLSELLSSDDGIPGHAPRSPAKSATVPTTKPEPVEDLFAPSTNLAMMDMFAPTPMSDIFAPQLTSSALPMESRGAAVAVAAQLLQRLEEAGHASCLPGLSVTEVADLIHLLRAQKAIDAAGPAVDACGARFVLYALERPPDDPKCRLSSAAVAWAMLSECHATLLDVSFAQVGGGDRDWQALRALGVGFWMPNGDALRSALETAAKTQFTRRKEAQDCALLYIALGKTKQLQALAKATRNEKLATFLSNDFTTERWLSAARKNAYSLLSKQQFELAIAFFLLGEDLGAAANVCARQLRDMQLALVLCRLNVSTKPTALRDLVRDELLPDATERGDIWLCCVAHLLLLEPSLALEVLGTRAEDPVLSLTKAQPPSISGLVPSTQEPCAAAFCAHLTASPRWRTPVPQAGPMVYLRSAYSLASMGCWLPAAETLLDCRDRGNELPPYSISVCRGLALRYLAGRAVGLLARSTTVGEAVLAMHDAIEILQDDAAAISAQLESPLDSLRGQAVREPIALADPLEFLPCLTLYIFLETWEQCHLLLESAVHALELRLGGRMPHQHAASSAFLARARMSLLASRAVLVAKSGLDEAGLLAQRIGDAAHHAAYAAGCSERDFRSVLKVLRSELDDDEAKLAPSDAPATAPSLETTYVWIRFHLCALPILQRQAAERQHVCVSKRAGDSEVLRVTTCAVREPHLLVQWLHLLQLTSRGMANRLSEGSFPIDPTALLSRGAAQAALTEAWGLIGGHDERPPASPNLVEHPSAAIAQAHGTVGATDAYGIWPLEHEQPEQTSRRLLRSVAIELSLGAPQELFHRKGEFVRAVCVNPLNPCQMAVALGRGVHQLDLADSLAAGADVWNETPLAVQHSVASENFAARCLCAHTKLPLFLAGGDSVVQCWQFGQAYQGQGLNDHLRAQYKLPAGGRVANIRISPLCSEQFGSIDDQGFVSLWRFQSGGEMPLPFNRLQCHTRRGGDLCFVDSSVILASVGLSQGGAGANSLCLWDVLLPPSQALVASCAAHQEGGRCVVHCAADQSLVSGGERGEIVVFDLRKHRIRERWRAHPAAVQALTLAQSRLCFSADAAGGLKLWDVSSPCSLTSPDNEEAGGKPLGEWQALGEQGLLAPLVGARGGVHSLFFSSSSRSLLTGGGDGRLLQWPVL